ncbi:MAG: hypothetical protein HYV99_07570 [Betaproteobacteria bacterium]|nr:hypothetical protein [Betaproteobacteria bacterium]MBI2509810.1 hypothetical protein [Betaproteobacteria bacterium]
MALTAITLTGCDYLPFGYTPVREITAAPAQFEGREVKLKGRVRGILKLGGLKAYTLQDDTGRVTVTTDGQLPAENAEVALKGTVKSALIVGGSAVGLRVEETKRLR